MDKLYSTHIPTTSFQKIILAAGSAAVAITNPRRGDMVAAMGETTAQYVLPNIKRRMQAHNIGRTILSEKPRIRNSTIDIDYLRKFPERTLGREYSLFLDRLNTSPDERPPVQFVDDLELVYVMRRYRESHDLYHTVLEMPTTMLGLIHKICDIFQWRIFRNSNTQPCLILLNEPLGEVAVKWFEGIQLGLPMCVLGGLFGAARLYPKQRRTFQELLLPWVIETAKNSEFLMNVYWEKHWEEPLDSLQEKLNIVKTPTV